MECTFCNIVSGKIQSWKLMEDQNTIVSFEVRPASLGHVIVFPKKHYESIEEMSLQEFFQLLSIVKFVASVLHEAVNPTGMSIVINSGQVPGFQTKHVSIHIIPLQGNEKMAVYWEPAKLETEQLNRLAQNLRDIIKRKTDEAVNKIKEHQGEIMQMYKKDSDTPQPVTVKSLEEQLGVAPKEEKKEDKKEEKKEPEVLRRRGFA